MAIRIYALAKELNLESKDLVELCPRAGIEGKGSALASLSEEEVESIRSFLKKGPSKPSAPERAAPERPAQERSAVATRPAPPKPPVLTRPQMSRPPMMGKPPVLTKSPSAKGPSDSSPTSETPPTLEPTSQEPTPAASGKSVASPSVAESMPVATASPPKSTAGSEAPPVVETALGPKGSTAKSPPAAEAAVVETPAEETPAAEIAASVEAPPEVAKPAAKALPGVPVRPTKQPLRREDYIGPGGGGGGGGGGRPTDLSRPKSLGGGGDAGKTDKRKDKEPTKPPLPKLPGIRLARMPEAPQPKGPAAGSAEPPAQKPEMRLPLEAIRSAKAGSKPLSEHIRKHEEKRKAEAATKAAPPARPGKPPTAEEAAAASRGRGKKGGPEEPGALDESLGGREARTLARKKTGGGTKSSKRDSRQGEDDGGGAPSRARRHLVRQRRGKVNTAAPRKGSVVVELPATVRSLSEALGFPAGQVLGKLMTQFGKAANINAELDNETAQLLVAEFGVDAEFKYPEDLEDSLLNEMEDREDLEENLEIRPPVVTFLGHVDHGKTSLLDKIIGINVVAGESGGITQHIRAYRVKHNDRYITFVDTPGHEAFTEMRARGANVTDIAVLIVAADDGVMPQTEEAISHARAAGVPIVVAMNKIDLHGIKPDRIMEQLAANELLPTAWGGDVEVVRTSAMTGEGIEELLETLLTVAELHELKANPSRAAYGTCLEAEMHEGRGVVAKVLVENGTLRNGDTIVCGAAYGRVKAMYDTLDGRVKHDQVGPSTPVNITGLDVAPAAGEKFYVLDDITQAREIAANRTVANKSNALLGPRKHVTLENLFETLEERQTQTLNLILRADTRGSIEAIKKELTKLEHAEVQIRLLQATVGGVSEADVHLADASDAVIIGFNVVPDEKARSLAESRGVQVRRYDIIYEITEHLRQALERKLKPVQRDVDLGRALVKRTFNISRVGTIAGCHVLAGSVERNARVRVIRDNQIIGDYVLESLKREKDDAREVQKGFECGIRLSGFNDLKEGDLLEVYRTEQVARTLEL